MTVTEITCAWCGRSQARRPSKVRPVNYCNRRCAAQARRRQVLLVCAKCDRSFFRVASAVRHPPPYYCTRRCAALSRGRKGHLTGRGQLVPLRPSIEDAARRYVAAVEAVEHADLAGMLVAECERDLALHDLFLACERPCKCDPPDTCPSYQAAP